jgi:hypothetical protein
MRAGRVHRAVLALLLVAAMPCEASDRAWLLRIPESTVVSFRGVASFDAAGQGEGFMLYPAPGLVGFAAALLTHGVLVDSVKESQKARIREQADEVLKPYAAALAAFTPAVLLGEGIARMRTEGSKRSALPAEGSTVEWLVESTPVFAMTQDRRALVMDNGIVVFRPGGKETAYRNVVRVVSNPVETPIEAGAHWGEAEGQRLREAAATMWADSIDAAISQVDATQGEATEKTVRYLEGGTERMERSQVIASRCGRLLIRTLRGELMSVPVRSTTGCPP